MYDEKLVAPMREEAVRYGAKELRTAAEVESEVGNAKGSVLVLVNSVCGCSAGGARPALGLALKSAKRPDKVVTVFAGQDREATEKARSYFVGYPPSSPAFALLKGGKIVEMLPRHEIEGYSADEIARKLTKAFEAHC